MSTQIAHGCWTGGENSRLLLSSTVDDKERHKLMKEGGAYSGIFKVDFLRNCALLGVVPHPLLIGEKKVKTVEQEAKEREEEERKEKEKQENENNADDNSAAAPSSSIAASGGATSSQAAPAAISQSPSASPPPTTAKNPKTASKGGRAGSAEKLTPSQRLAAELATITANLTLDEQKPLQELSVRGWELDIATASALQMTIPHSRSLHTLRFWNANLNPRAITTLADSLKNSSVTRFYLDYNPLHTEKGHEPGLVYSLLLAPSSPLQFLSLRGNKINDVIVSEIMRVASSNKNLIALDLFDNEIADAGCDAIAKMLGLNPNLQSLNLSHNHIRDNGSKSLMVAFQSVAIPDKEEAKNLKKAGFRITTVKNRTYREANQSIKILNLTMNYIGDAGLKEWVDMNLEQAKYTPAKGLVSGPDGVETQFLNMVPTRLLEPAEQQARAEVEAAKAAAAAAAAAAIVASSPTASGGPSSARKTPRNRKEGGTESPSASPLASPTSAASKAELAAAKAAAAAKKEEEDMRYPGQLNNLTQVNLCKQYSRTSEARWFQLKYAPLIRWSASSSSSSGSEEEQWNPEGNLNVLAIDWLEAEAKEAQRVAALNEEEKVREAEEKRVAAEAAKNAAADAALNEQKSSGSDKKKPARKDRKKAADA